MTQDTSELAVTLEPCPHCGGPADLRGADAPEYWVGCAAIGCKATTEGFGSKERAIAAWNRRASPPVNDAGIRKALEQILHSVKQARVPGNDWKRELVLIENLTDAALDSAQQPAPAGDAERRDMFDAGYAACWAEMFVKMDQNPAFALTDAIMDRAWEIHLATRDDAATPPAQDQKGEEGNG